MLKRLLIIFLLAMPVSQTLLAETVPVYELGVYEQIGDSKVELKVNSGTVTISGASGLTLEVVSLTGKLIKQVKIVSMVQVVELNIPKGCYILKVGNLVRKVSVN